jgi:hypothetical protein
MPDDAAQPNPQPSGSGLTVRRFERHELSLPVRVTLDHSSGSVVRLSRSSGGSDGFGATLVDLGQGGLGIESPHYLPRRTVLRVRLLADTLRHLPEFQTTVKVMRSRMSSREPSYALGCSFVEPDARLQQTVEDVLSAIAASRQEEEAA